MQTDGSMVGHGRRPKISNAPIIVAAIIVGVAIVAGGAFAAGVFDPPKRPTPSAQDESPQRNQPAPVANRNTPQQPTTPVRPVEKTAEEKSLDHVDELLRTYTADPENDTARFEALQILAHLLGIKKRMW